MKNKLAGMLAITIAAGAIAGCAAAPAAPAAPAQEAVEEAAAEAEEKVEEAVEEAVEEVEAAVEEQTEAAASGEKHRQFPEGAKAAETESAEPLKIIVTTTHKPGAASYQCEQFIQQVFDEKAPGMFNFEMYDSATLFKTDAEFPAILAHEANVSFIQPSYMYDNGLPWANMLDMGYLFDSVDHMKATFDPEGEIGAYLQQAIWDEFHVMTFGCDYIGTRDLWLAEDKDINTPEDCEGLTIRMPTSASFVQLGEALGFNVTPLDVSEVYLAMETGLIDGHENQIFSTYAQGQFEVCKTLVFIEHMITPNFITLDGDIWEQMTTEQQEIFYDCMCEARDLTIEWAIEEEQNLLKEAKDTYNIRFQYPDKAPFKEKVQAAYLSNKDISGKWDLELLEKINALGDSMK